MTINEIQGKAQSKIFDWLNRHEPSKPKAIFAGMKEEGYHRSYSTLVTLLFRMRKQGILEKIDEKYRSTSRVESIALPKEKEEHIGEEESMETLESINLQIDITELLLTELYKKKLEILKTLTSKAER